jgi:hypothetical protein
MHAAVPSSFLGLQLQQQLMGVQGWVLEMLAGFPLLFYQWIFNEPSLG